MNIFLSSKEIHVWFSPFSISKPKKSTPSCSGEVSPSLKILRFLLAHYLKCPPDALVFEKTPQGKLFLPKYPHLFFNLTHSGELLALAISTTPVGIDLEKKRKVKALALAHKFFSSEEINFITSKGEEFVEEKFLQLWTAKEAVLKGDGRGITAGLREVFASIKEQEITSLILEDQRWHVFQQTLQKIPEYLVAVATMIPNPLIRWYNFTSSVSLADSCPFKTST